MKYQVPLPLSRNEHYSITLVLGFPAISIFFSLAFPSPGVVLVNPSLSHAFFFRIILFQWNTSWIHKESASVQAATSVDALGNHKTSFCPPHYVYLPAGFLRLDNKRQIRKISGSNNCQGIWTFNLYQNMHIKEKYTPFNELSNKRKGHLSQWSIASMAKFFTTRYVPFIPRSKLSSWYLLPKTHFRKMNKT